MDASIRAKNKEQDFSDLEKASETMQNKMRMDEDYPDLFNQLQYRSDINGCHRYFIEPYKSLFGPMVEHSTFIPFPKEILQQYSRIECASFMGILPEVHRVWVTVDNILYLWNYQNPEDFEVYDGVSEVIVSVSISTPKPGIFLDSVKYLLVLATPVEIIILALCGDEQNKQVKIVPTTYNLPSDNVTMLKIVGSQPGRVFMVGNDNNLYELEYSNSDSNWASSLLSGISGPQRKCRKVNHFAWEWQVTNLLPNFITKSFGGHDDQFADMVVDNARNILYAVTAHGKLTAIYLGISGYETHIFERSFDIIEQTQRYLSMAMGMRSAGTPHPSSFTNTSSPCFQIVGIFPVPMTESKRIQLIVVLANGIRIYLSLEGEYGGRYNGIDTVSAVGNVPQRLSIAAVRSPPSTTTVANCATSSSSFEDSSGDLENGSIPTFVPSQQLAISRAYYAQGIFMLTLDKLQQPDELLCIFEDILSRSNSASSSSGTTAAPAGATGRTNTESLSCLKEGVTLSLDAVSSGGKIFDIKESCHYQISDPVAAQMQSLFAFSKVPGGSTSNLIRETTHHVHPDTLPPVVVPTTSSDFLSNLIESEDKVYNTNATPLTFSNAMSMSSSKASKFGIEKQNLDNLVLLGEISTQHIPLADKIMNRQLLVLTNSGIHIFKKNHPADLLYDILTRVDLRADELIRRFFQSFGMLQSSIMCVGLATGVPKHVGQSANAFIDPLAPSVSSADLVAQNVQLRAMTTVVTSTPGPTYRALIPAAGYAALQDSRIIQNDNAKDFIPSVAHDAMYSFLGRLIRPIWFRAVVDNHTRKVSKIWSQALIEEIRQPLNNLKNLIANFYGASIRGGNHSNSTVGKRKVTGGSASTDLITAQISNQSRQQVSGEKALALEAKAVEDTSIRCLYHLISRTLHALSLIELLLTVEHDWKVNIRELSDLNNFSFRSIVVLPKLHDQTKRVVQQLIHTLIRSKKTDLADRAIDWLSREVYHYFSAGDRYTFEATKRLDVISRMKQTNDHSISSTDADALISECIKLFHNAVSYWNSPEYVVGDQSELVTTCASLLSLGPLGRDAVVDLCLKAASNFSQVSSVSAREYSGGNAWDSALYHGGSVLTDRDRSNSITACYDCLIKQILWLGSKQSMIGSGVLVADSMAAATPAQIEQETLRMIQRAVSKSDDVKFHERLYLRLLTDDSKLLLQINSPYIEEFLKNHDSNLLHLYYIASVPDRGPQYMKAANLMYILAIEGDDVIIDQRIEFLRKAVSSAKEALGPQQVAISTNPYVGKGGLYSSSSSASLSMADKLMVDNLQELVDLLDVAEFQREIAIRLEEEYNQFQATFSSSGGRSIQHAESLNQQLRLMKDWVRKLKLKLLTISEMFNEVCVQYNMWDMSLRLLQMSNTVDDELISRLWRSFIYKFVPTQASSNDARDFLMRKKDNRFVEIDSRLPGNNKIFDQPSDWLPSLRANIFDLAGKLKIDDFSPFCPLHLLVQELEDILSTLHIVVGDASAQQQNIPRDFVSAMLRDLKVPILHIVEVYFWLLDQWKHQSSEKQIHLLASILDFMETWINFAKSENGDDRGYLELAISEKHTQRWLAEISRQFAALKHDNRWADLIQNMLKKEYDISTSIYDMNSK